MSLVAFILSFIFVMFCTFVGMMITFIGIQYKTFHREVFITLATLSLMWYILIVFAPFSIVVK